MKWTVGSVEITSIIEQDLTEINELIWGAKRDAVQEIDWLLPNYAEEDGTLKGLIQSFILDAPSARIVVDTCIGDNKDRRYFKKFHECQTGFLERFEQAGFTRGSIDYVLCTHMHSDHVGWNTMWDGDKWIPTFPNARYLFADTELAFWETENAEDKGDPATAETKREAGNRAFVRTQIQTHIDSIAPVFEQGLADSVPTNHQVCEEVKLIPTPGHTPGHVSVWIASQGQEAVITGDCIHHPCQIARPNWPTVVDHDQEMGNRTRQNLLETARNQGTLFIGTHFCEPTAGQIEKDGDGYILKAE